MRGLHWPMLLQAVLLLLPLPQGANLHKVSENGHFQMVFAGCLALVLVAVAVAGVAASRSHAFSAVESERSGTRTATDSWAVKCAEAN